MIAARILGLLAIGSLYSLANAVEPAIKDFPDPKPPTVTPIAGTEKPAPQKHPRVTFFKAPKSLAPGAKTSDWPHFMGPSRDMKSTETMLLSTFPKEGPAKVWELERGTGYVSPSIVGDTLYYQHRLGNEVFVECLQASTGKLFWQHKYPSTYEDRYGYSNGPRCTPAIAGDRVVIAGVEGQLFCLNRHTGAVLWERDLKKEFNIPGGFFGFGATPLILGDRIIINSGGSGSPCVTAFSLTTGQLIWATGKQWGSSYASPAPITVHGRKRVAVLAGGESKPAIGGLLLLEPNTGTIVARYPWRSKKYESVNAANPVIIGSSILISASYQKGSTVLDLGKPGTDQSIPLTPKWADADIGFHWNTPVVENGYAYGFSGRNVADLVCFQFSTGKVQWSESIGWTETYDYYGEKRERDLDLNRGSILAADGRHYIFGEYGHFAIMNLSPQAPQVLAHTWLFPASETWTPPVISRGLLYACQNSKRFTDSGPRKLICYDLRKAP